MIQAENDTSFFMYSTATLVQDDRDIASDWASQHIHTNKALKWIIAKYVEADRANSNGQFWTLGDLQASRETIRYSPINVGHHQTEIVGTWTNAEMIYPTESASVTNPYIETLGAMWKYYFPEHLKTVEQAYESGNLYVSMECQGDSVTCGGEDGCGETFEYKGPMDESYCEHILDRTSYRQINNPHFLAGALILPPNRPGWVNASVSELASKTTDEQKDEMLQMIAADHPELSPAEWEKQMWMIQKAMADKGSLVSADESNRVSASLLGLRIGSEFMARSYR